MIKKKDEDHLGFIAVVIEEYQNRKQQRFLKKVLRTSERDSENIYKS